MSIAFSNHSERATHGIDDVQPKEKRRSRLREQRDELLAALKVQVLARRDNGDESAGLRVAEALIARIEGDK